MPNKKGNNRFLPGFRKTSLPASISYLLIIICTSIVLSIESKAQSELYEENDPNFKFKLMDQIFDNQRFLDKLKSDQKQKQIEMQFLKEELILLNKERSKLNREISKLNLRCDLKDSDQSKCIQENQELERKKARLKTTVKNIIHYQSKIDNLESQSEEIKFFIKNAVPKKPRWFLMNTQAYGNYLIKQKEKEDKQAGEGDKRATQTLEKLRSVLKNGEKFEKYIKEREEENRSKINKEDQKRNPNSHQIKLERKQGLEEQVEKYEVLLEELPRKLDHSNEKLQKNNQVQGQTREDLNKTLKEDLSRPRGITLEKQLEDKNSLFLKGNRVENSVRPPLDRSHPVPKISPVPIQGPSVTVLGSSRRSAQSNSEKDITSPLDKQEEQDESRLYKTSRESIHRDHLQNQSARRPENGEGNLLSKRASQPIGSSNLNSARSLNRSDRHVGSGEMEDDEEGSISSARFDQSEKELAHSGAHWTKRRSSSLQSDTDEEGSSNLPDVNSQLHSHPKEKKSFLPSSSSFFKLFNFGKKTPEKNNLADIALLNEQSQARSSELANEARGESLKLTRKLHNFSEIYFSDIGELKLNGNYKKAWLGFKSLINKVQSKPILEYLDRERKRSFFEEILNTYEKLKQLKPPSGEELDDEELDRSLEQISNQIEESFASSPRLCEFNSGLQPPLKLSQFVNPITKILTFFGSLIKIHDRSNSILNPSSTVVDYSKMESDRDGYRQLSNKYLAASRSASIKARVIPKNFLGKNNTSMIVELKLKKNYYKLKAADAIHNAFLEQKEIVSLLNPGTTDLHHSNPSEILAKEEKKLVELKRLSEGLERYRSTSKEGSQILDNYKDWMTKKVDIKKEEIGKLVKEIEKADEALSKKINSKNYVRVNDLKAMRLKEEKKLEELESDLAKINQENEVLGKYNDQGKKTSSQGYDNRQAFALSSSDNVREGYRIDFGQLSIIDEEEDKTFREEEPTLTTSSQGGDSPRVFSNEEPESEEVISSDADRMERGRRSSREFMTPISQSSQKNSTVTQENHESNGTKPKVLFLKNKDSIAKNRPVTMERVDSTEPEHPQLKTPSVSKNIIGHIDSDHSSLNDEFKYKSLGFENLGNTCFANATFKLLLANPEFVDFVNLNNHPSNNFSLKKDGKDKAAIGSNENSDDNNIRKSLNKLFTRYQSLERLDLDRSQSKNENPFFTKELNSFYTEFNSYLKRKYGAGKHPYFLQKENGFIPRDQQDATEFFGEILDVLKIEGVFNLSTRPESSDGTRWNPSSSEIVFPIHLPILGSNVNSLSEAFDENVKEETLDPEYGVNADHGGEKLTQMKNKISVPNLGQIPTYFFATVKRFNNNLEKEEKYIDSKTPIHMHVYQKGSEWNDNAKSKMVNYEPIGFVVHSGKSPKAGHYYAYIYNDQSKSWFKHDDAEVTKLNRSNEIEGAWKDINKNGYIVLYQKKSEVPAD